MDIKDLADAQQQEDHKLLMETPLKLSPATRKASKILHLKWRPGSADLTKLTMKLLAYLAYNEHQY